MEEKEEGRKIQTRSRPHLQLPHWHGGDRVKHAHGDRGLLP